MEQLLRAAYFANILILAPVLVALWRERSSRMLMTFNGTVENSDGLRQLVMALWFSILACSGLGLIWPRIFVPILLLQIIYKLSWLCTFVLPRLSKHGFRQVPWGVSVTFLAIVIAWPIILLRLLPL